MNIATGLCRLIAPALLVLSLPLGRAHAQTVSDCHVDRALSTIVGAGLGAAAGAIPATIVHRYDQTTSHRIVAVSVSAGAVIGFLGSGRDHPCTVPRDSALVPNPVISIRGNHASRGMATGALIGGLAGVVGSTFLAVGCETDGCNPTRDRVAVALYLGGTGALAGGILGTLVGWAWPVRR